MPDVIGIGLGVAGFDDVVANLEQRFLNLRHTLLPGLMFTSTTLAQNSAQNSGLVMRRRGSLCASPARSAIRQSV